MAYSAPNVQDARFLGSCHEPYHMAHMICHMIDHVIWATSECYLDNCADKIQFYIGFRLADHKKKFRDICDKNRQTPLKIKFNSNIGKFLC